MFDELYEKIRKVDGVESGLLSLLEGKTWEQIALALYGILDNIDTADDACREDSEAFRSTVLKLQAKKNQYLYSPDGYEIEPAVEIDEEEKEKVSNDDLIDNLMKYNITEPIVKEGMVDYSRRELELAGMFDKDVDGDKTLGEYNIMMSEAVLELMKIFAGQGHSGMSAAMVRELFSKLSNFEPLTELTDDPGEWNDVSEMSQEDHNWQSSRSPSCFSYDGGKTYWDINEDYFFHTDDNGVRWSGGLSKEEWHNRPIHTSKHIEKEE